MGFLKDLGIGGGEAGGGSNFLSKLFGGSPERASSIANQIGMGANQIAQAGGAEAGYQSMQQPQMMPNQDMNNFLAQLLERKQQTQQPGMIPQNMSWYGVGNG